MYNPDKYAAALNKVIEFFEAVEALFISKVAKQIQKIGELNQTSINRLLIMRDMGADVAEVKTKLQEATGLSTRVMAHIYQTALNDRYTDQRFDDFVKTVPPTEARQDNARLNQLARAMLRQTAGELVNLSNTTNIDNAYREAIDPAIAAVAAGVEDYQSATRDAVRTMAVNGLRVTYESGYTRRLDSAVRQNITNGVKQLAQQSSLMIGEMMGDDAIELSAHLRSAPDHEPVQGRVFLNAEFAKLQSQQAFSDIDGHRYEAIKRPIGEWNCGHIGSSFNTQHSIRTYTDEQLRQFAEENARGCEINGKHLSTYEASQLMRKVETKIRQQKDIANAARDAGDETLRVECQKKINRLKQYYGQIADASGLREQQQRLRVDGFKSVRVPKNK